MSDSWGCLYCILRSIRFWQLRVSILYTEDHLCLTDEAVVYCILRITCVWQLGVTILCILRNTCVWQLRVSIVYTKDKIQNFSSLIWIHERVLFHTLFWNTSVSFKRKILRIFPAWMLTTPMLSRGTKLKFWRILIE